MPNHRLFVASTTCALFATLAGCEEKRVEPEPLPVATIPTPEPLTVNAATLPGATVTGAPTEIAAGVLSWERTPGTGVQLDGETWATFRINAWTADGTQWFGDAQEADELVLPTGDADAFSGWSLAVEGMTEGARRKVYLDASYMDVETLHWPVPGGEPTPLIMDIELVAVGDGGALTELPGFAVGDTAKRGSSTGLRWYDLTTGVGPGLSEGDRAEVTINAYLPDGTLAWSSGTTPTVVTIDETLMPGIREGLVGIAPGGVRKLVIPPALGAGFDPQGDLPAGTILVVDITAQNAHVTAG